MNNFTCDQVIGNFVLKDTLFQSCLIFKTTLTPEIKPRLEEAFITQKEHVCVKSLKGEIWDIMFLWLCRYLFIYLYSKSGLYSWAIFVK